MQNELSMMLRAQRLFQQFLVNTNCKLKVERLSYLRLDQNRLKGVYYTSLREFLGGTGVAVDDGEDWSTGILSVLPTAFIEKDRNLTQKMFDIISMSNKLDHPDIFSIMKCNTKWNEINEALLHGQTAPNGVDICAREF